MEMRMNHDTQRKQFSRAVNTSCSRQLSRGLLLAACASAALAVLPMSAHATTLPNGSGVLVAQVEAQPADGQPATTDMFEVVPADSAVNTSIAIQYMDFNGYISSTAGYSYSITSGTTSTPYTDAQSTHADSVASYFYGSSGYATGVSGVDNIDAGIFQGYFLGITNLGSASFAPQHTSYTNNSQPGSPTMNIGSDKVINQSFVDTNSSTNPVSSAVFTAWVAQVAAAYDQFTNSNKTIFISAVGDGTTASTTPPSQINPPATAYNSIAVGAYPYSSTSTGLGPTSDGRSKPDIVANGAATSYSAPIVSGAAAAMVQAGNQADGYVSGDGFANQAAYTTAATDERTVKALLLNGAVKPAGWTNSYTVTNGTYTYQGVAANATTPLDPRYGAGIVNLGNAYATLAAGRTAASTAPISQTTGWDFSTISSGSNNAADYVFNLSSANQAYDLTGTLVWNAQVQAVTLASAVTYNETLNNLDLILLNAAGSQVASSESAVDNVQQIYTLGLTPGTYTLEVVDKGGAAVWASTSDPYAIAYNFQPVPEPAAVVLLLLGLASMPMLRRNGRRV
jgi:hypothetical protein